jgi:hypothetical protein
MMSDPIIGGRVPYGAVTVAESATEGRFESMSALYEREDQTATFMRCSPSAVNSLVARGLAAMRQQIGPPDD